MSYGYVTSGALMADCNRERALKRREQAHRYLRRGSTEMFRREMGLALFYWGMFRERVNEAHSKGYRWPHER